MTRTFRQSTLTAAALAFAAFAGTAFAFPTTAQPASQPAAAEPTQAAPAYTPPGWTSPDLQKIGEMLVGTWKTATPVPQAGSPDTKVDIVMHVVPVKFTDLTDTMYVEIARADAPHKPYRQAIFQLYKFKDKPRLRTYEFFRRDNAFLAGLWAVPQFLPAFESANVIATLDVELTPSADGYVGKTPYPYPTGVGGAVEMTTNMKLGKDTLESEDRGFDAGGKVVWGSGPNDKYVFKRSQPTLTVKQLDGGLTLLAFAQPTEGRPIETGDRVGAHYSGYLTNGFQFDSSRPRGQPLLFTQGNLIQGWNKGLLGLTKGSIVKVVIPSELGYGAQGQPRAGIPANATLIFDIEIMSVDAPLPPQTEGAAPQSPTQPAQQPAQPAQPATQPK